MEDLKGIEYVCNRIVKGWINKNIITEEFEEWYTFGLFSFVSGIINIAIFIILGTILGLLPETLIYLLVFTQTREFMGGYHCDTPLSCKICSTAIYLFVMLVNHYHIFGSYLLYVSLAAFIVGNIIIYIYCPVQNHNKILPLDKQKRFKIISYFTYNIMVVFGLVLIYINSKFADIVTTALILVDLLAVAGFYKERRVYNVR